MDLSPITEDLMIGTTPIPQDYPCLRDLGVRLVINMRLEHPPKPDLHQPPLDFLWLPTIDSPLLVIPIRFLMRGAKAAMETIKSKGKVFAHCAGGRHRGVAMGASILIAQGYKPEAAMALIKARRPLADPDIFYIHDRILRFEHAWQKMD
jgi:protein-tyrosine phosphatase